jgi:hypothetical protein
MNDDCVHYWVINTPSGKTSWGQCKTCLVWREFDNTISDQGWDRPGKNSLVIAQEGTSTAVGRVYHTDEPTLA